MKNIGTRKQKFRLVNYFEPWTEDKIIEKDVPFVEIGLGEVVSKYIKLKNKWFKSATELIMIERAEQMLNQVKFEVPEDNLFIR